MPDISRIKTADNIVYNVKDDVARDVLNKQAHIFYVVGSSTDSVEGTWTGAIEGLSEYYDGLTVLYVPAIAGASTTSLNINDLGAVPCHYSGETSMAVSYPAGVPILLTYQTGNTLVPCWKAGDPGKISVPSGVVSGKFLQTDANGNAVWGDAASASTVASATEQWLENNISGGETLAIDRSLTVNGAAAESKTVGDTFNALRYNQENDYGYDVDFDENTNTLYLKNSNGSRIGLGTSIQAGISGLEMHTETIDSLNYLVLSDQNGIEICRTEIVGGGSGSGGTDNVTMSMTNGMEWLSTTLRLGSSCPLTVSWASTIDDVPTGNGTMKITVNRSVRETLNVTQGNVTVDVGPYLSSGGNSVSLSVQDAYGKTRTIIFTINCVMISLTSSFDSSSVYTSAFQFPYTPIGNVSKVMHFKLDGTEQETVSTTVSNHQLTYPIPVQTHGTHSIECWFTSEINNETVSSNHLYYEYIYAVEGSTDPIIAVQFHETSVNQYYTTAIPYQVYDPQSPQCEVSIYENDVLKTTLTVGRDVQQYSYRAASAGNAVVKFVAGSTEKSVSFTVNATSVDVDAETEGLILYLSAEGRSNNEEHPEIWNYNTIQAQMTGVDFTSDGWQQDTNGVTSLRLSGDARVVIPFKIFEEDFRASGRTIEFEFATSNVRNYDTPIVSCVSGGRGLLISSQNVFFASEQRSIYTQFKDDEHVRLSFVIQNRSEQRLILVYINGIVSGTIQYPDNDDFSQIEPVNITLGGDDATLDIFNIRVYDHALTRFQVLNNWIADKQNGYDFIGTFEHNDIFDEYGNIVISKLPNDLPYLILNGALPTYKGNKLIVTGEYVDPLNASKSFTFENAQIDVQGTSSQYYARKNYKIKFQNGFVSGGNTVSKYAMNSDAIPVKTFTFKADVASSEGANNVELARLYNEACPYKTPYQKTNAKVRQGIDGFPIVIFHNNGTDTTFLGKYNFNNDKGTEEVFGFQEGDESWEIKNNTSNRVLWKSADYATSDWLNDFEGRYPEDNTDATNLYALAAWLVSTDRTQATENALPESVTYTDEVDGETVSTTYTTDSAEYRLAKFRHELEDHMELNSVLFYYLFTELFLMVDSRAKNAFPSRLGGDKWCILPYDFDTALGINNEGSLAFSYNLEDTDTVGSADVFNGQDSVLWCNLRDAFGPELKAMYQELRSDNVISFEKVEGMFEAHQHKWPEAIFNEDAQYKYLDPLINENDASYLGMLQGSKEQQRKWWMYNRFRYIDSKYNAGDALTDVIQLRGYAKADITVVPYADIYPAVKYGSYLVSQRGTRNVPATLVNPLDNVNDTEIYIYSCSQLASVGDLSGLKVGFADFSRAIKLQTLKIGDSDSNYENSKLTVLHLGNNTLLQTIDVRNCTSLAQPVDLTGCVALENVYFDNTAITGVSLPNGGTVKVLHLPETITNLTILNQTRITDFTCPDFSNITTLRLENVPDTIDTLEIVEQIAEGSRVRLYNFHWELDNLSDLADLYDKLDTMRGLDQNGNNTATAQVFGSVHVPAATGAEMAALEGRYSDVTVTYDSLVSYLKYYDFYGTTLLHTETIQNGGNGTWNETPTKPSDTAQYTFGQFAGWSLTPESDTIDSQAKRHVTADRNIYAAFDFSVRTYTATFKLSSSDGSTTLYTQQNIPYGTTPVYGGTTPVSTRGEEYVFDDRWSPVLGPIAGNTTYEAVFRFTGSVTRAFIKRTIPSIENDIVTSIGNDAFFGCSQLTEALFPAATSIGSSAFQNCYQLTNISFPLVTSIGDCAFQNCYQLTNISFPLVTSIGASAFYGCSQLTEVSFPAVTSIGGSAFFSCSQLTEVSFPAVTSIGGSAFFSCSQLTEALFPAATSIGDCAFQDCSQLTEVSFPVATSINSQAFYSCSRLTEASFPAATSIGYNAFNGCSKLTKVILGNTQQVCTLSNTNAFNNTTNAIIYVPDALVDSYKAATNWSTYASRIKSMNELPA